VKIAGSIKRRLLLRSPTGKLTVDDLLIEFKAFLYACGFEVDGVIVVQKTDPGPQVDV
jgi:hypothetical protein